jgi:hypothetical protein
MATSFLRPALAAGLTVGVGDITGGGAEMKDGMTGSAGPEPDSLTAGSPCDTPRPGIGASTGPPRGAGAGNVGCVAGIGRATGAGADNGNGTAFDGVTDGMTT